MTRTKTVVKWVVIGFIVNMIVSFFLMMMFLGTALMRGALS